MKIRIGFRWFSPPGEMPPLLFGGKAGTVMTGFASHYTMKIRMGFRWFSPSGKMPPLLFGGKAGTVMTGFASHYIIKRSGKQNFFPAKSGRIVQPVALPGGGEGFFKGKVVRIIGSKDKTGKINLISPH